MWRITTKGTLCRSGLFGDNVWCHRKAYIIFTWMLQNSQNVQNIHKVPLVVIYYLLKYLLLLCYNYSSHTILVPSTMQWFYTPLLSMRHSLKVVIYSMGTHWQERCGIEHSQVIRFKIIYKMNLKCNKLKKQWIDFRMVSTTPLF